MSKRIVSMARFALLVLFEVLLALRLDGFIQTQWIVVFIPIFFWEAIALRRKIYLVKMTIVTHDELELAIGKKFADCSAAEREDIHCRYIIVPAKKGSIYEAAQRLQSESKGDIVRISARMLFTVLLVLNLDTEFDWSWWIVFLPLLGMAFCIVGAAFNSFAEIQAEAAKRDPALFGMPNTPGNDEEQQIPTSQEDGAETPASTPYTKMDESKNNPSGEGTEPLSDEEKDEIKAKVMQSAYRAVGTCFSQCFLVFLMCLLIGKIQGEFYCINLSCTLLRLHFIMNWIIIHCPDSVSISTLICFLTHISIVLLTK